MSVCRNEEMNKGGSYPKSCPTCKLWTSECKFNVKPDPASGIDPKYYIGDFNVDKYAVIIEESYSEEVSLHASRDYSTVKYDTVKYFDHEIDLINWLKGEKDRVYGAKKVKKVIKYQALSVETEVVVKLK